MDRRVKRTRKLLGDALVFLLQEQALQEITIRQITEGADVAYSTFFRNFESIEALLLSHLYDFIASLKDKMRSHIDAPYPVQARTTIQMLFQIFQDDPELPRVLFLNPTAQPVLKAFRSEQIDLNLQVLNHVKLNQNTDAPPPELIIHNTIIQLFGLVEWWLEHSMQPDPSYMAIYYEQMVLRPMWTLLLGAEGMTALFGED